MTETIGDCLNIRDTMVTAHDPTRNHRVLGGLIPARVTSNAEVEKVFREGNRVLVRAPSGRRCKIVRWSGTMRHRTLIAPPLKWQMTTAPVSPPTIPVIAERGGTQLKVPRGVVLVDTREQNPFDFSRFTGWFSRVEKKALTLGDYGVSGLEDVCVVERKHLDDLVHSFTVERPVFVDRLRRMRSYPHRLLVITASLSEIKSPYPYSGTNPNRIIQSLVASLAGLGVPFVTTENHELGEEIVASYLYQVHLYEWLDANGYGRYLADNDL